VVCVLLAILAGAATQEKLVCHPVAREVIEKRLQTYAGNNKQREATLKQLFADAGCVGDHVSEQRVKESKLPNVICTLPGSSDRVIIVGAHFDHVSQGDGVVDNWSGASLLPSLYEAIHSEPHQHTYIFIGFTDEEKGEIGSEFYAHQMSRQQIAITDAMVNMDTLGLSTTKVGVSHSDNRLISALLEVARQLNVPVAGMNVEQVGSTDSEQFARRAVPSITIHSLTQESWNARILHTDKDKIAKINLDDYYQTYRLMAVYLAYLDSLTKPGPTGKEPHLKGVNQERQERINDL
jgi:Zn-dependent M28 family amino/carboxypeptidase